MENERRMSKQYVLATGKHIILFRMSAKYSNMFINIELTLTYTLFRTRKRRYARPIIAYKEHKTFFHNPIFQLDGQQTEEPCFI